MRLVVHGLLHRLRRWLPVHGTVLLVLFMLGGRGNLRRGGRLGRVILHRRVGGPRHLLRCGHHFGCFYSPLAMLSRSELWRSRRGGGGSIDMDARNTATRAMPAGAGLDVPADE